MIGGASIEESERLIGIEADRFIVFGNRAIVLFLFEIHHAAADERVCAKAVTRSAGRIEAGRFLIVAFRAVALALVSVGQGAAGISTCEIFPRFVNGFDDRRTRAQPLIQGRTTATGAPFPVLGLL